MNDVIDSQLSLEITRRFDAPPERVFDAWTGKQWGEWLPPGGARCSAATVDMRVGGRYEMTMTMPDGRTASVAGTYKEIDRPNKLVFTWLGCFHTHETLVTVTFRGDRGGTIMTMRQTGFEDIEVRDKHIDGWGRDGGSFDKLAAVLAK
jgi:uncharacterized protein YndB with AHSA1/START domain